MEKLHHRDEARDEIRGRLRARNSLPLPAARKALRLAHSLSLQDVANAVGVTHEAVRLWELGARKVSRRHVVAYAELLDLMRKELG
jgi:DNA-binding transcriptional regulator YiaG